MDYKKQHLGDLRSREQVRERQRLEKERQELQAMRNFPLGWDIDKEQMRKYNQLQWREHVRNAI